MHTSLIASSWAGSEVSRGGLREEAFLQDGIVQCLLSNEFLEAAILALEFLEALDLVQTKSSPLFTPAVVRLL